MSVQTSYAQATPRGVAGGLVDLSAHQINTRMNGETGNAMKFGMGVVQGAAPGSDIKLPAAGATGAKFEGITVNGYTVEMDRNGKVTLPPAMSVGVMRYGNIWARTKAGIKAGYGDPLYLIISGENAGLFTNAEETGATVLLKGRFIGTKGSSDVAPVELFNQAHA